MSWLPEFLRDYVAWTLADWFRDRSMGRAVTVTVLVAILAIVIRWVFRHWDAAVTTTLNGVLLACALILFGLGLWNWRFPLPDGAYITAECRSYALPVFATMPTGGRLNVSYFPKKGSIQLKNELVT